MEKIDHNMPEENMQKLKKYQNEYQEKYREIKKRNNNK